MFSECNNMWNELQIKQIREIIEKEALDFSLIMLTMIFIARKRPKRNSLKTIGNG